MMKKIMLLYIVLAMTLLITGVYAASTSTITRVLPSNVTRCSPVNVSLNINVDAPDTFYILDEMFPAGWDVTNPGSGNTQHSGHIKWAVISGASDIQYNYTITSSCSLGTYNFTGLYGFDDSVIRTVSGQEVVQTIPFCQTQADSNANGIIELSEAISYANRWFTGNISRADLLLALTYWKAGSGC